MEERRGCVFTHTEVNGLVKFRMASQINPEGQYIECTLTPSEARRIAWGILGAAERADGMAMVVLPNGSVVYKEKI